MWQAMLNPDCAAILLMSLARPFAITVQLEDAGLDPARRLESCIVRQSLLDELVESQYILNVERRTHDEAAVLHGATCVGRDIRSMMLVCHALRDQLLLGTRVPLPYSWRPPLRVPAASMNILCEVFAAFLQSDGWRPIAAMWHPVPPALPDDSLLLWFLSINTPPHRTVAWHGAQHAALQDME